MYAAVIMPKDGVDYGNESWLGMTKTREEKQ